MLFYAAALQTLNYDWDTLLLPTQTRFRIILGLENALPRRVLDDYAGLTYSPPKVVACSRPSASPIGR